LNHPLKFLIKTLLVTMIYMMCSLLVDMFHVMFLFNLNMLYVNVMFTMNMMFWFIMNKHLITTVFIISFYWIKLNLKLSIFLTVLATCRGLANSTVQVKSAKKNSFSTDPGRIRILCF
jgi:hypothetical protein